MNLTLRYLLIVGVAAASAICNAQTGTVTFYSDGSSLKQAVRDAVVPVGTIPFTGWLFDGDQKLAHFQGGRFVTFHLAAGDHSFTVPYHPDHPGKTTLQLKVEADTHYCVRLNAKYVSASPLAPVGYADSRIAQVSCQEAVKEAGDFKPIDHKRVDPAALAEVEDSRSFPTGS